ncbi:MAG: DNA-directed polymerase subunit beta [Bacillales bacterium]|jgi:Flp pilus assembly protein TadB|nr:DNA-directed polymerase subunit beta [Bacillales bacterium]
MVTIQDKELNPKEESRWSRIVSDGSEDRKESRGTRRNYQQNSRQELKNQNKERKKRNTDGQFSVRLRLIPVWLRLVIISVVSVVAGLIGAYFGYVVLGDGKASEVFSPSTWHHIFDLVNKAK